MADEIIEYTPIKAGRVRFYMDADVEDGVTRYLRQKGFRVESAQELGYANREDGFHLQEAARRRCTLVSRDSDYLDDQKFPFDKLKNTTVVVLRTEPRYTKEYGYMLLALENEIGRSAKTALHGMKIEICGPRVIFRSVEGGQVRTSEIDISKPRRRRRLFENHNEDGSPT